MTLKYLDDKIDSTEHFFVMRKEMKKNFLFEHVNSLMIVDRELIVRYATRPMKDRGMDRGATYIGKHLFEVFNQLSAGESTMVECINTGKTIIREKQRIVDYKGNIIILDNITYPIINSGKIVGAVELCVDATSLGDLERQVDAATEEKQQSKILEKKYTWDDIITNNQQMKDCIRNAKIFAGTDDPVLIYGETGTGKELFVEAMVSENLRRGRKYIVQNCAAIPENLFEFMFFGSVRGGFTGAENKKGLFETADGGVLFLDEFNSVPFHLQPKLLRVIQDGCVKPIGSNVQKKVDVKVIVAVNKNPLQLVKDGLMREDLFFRFSGSMLSLIPLRDRKEDIIIYAGHFITEFNRKYNKKISGMSDDFLDVLMKYDWPGNVRELKNVFDFAIKISDGDVIDKNNIPAYLKEEHHVLADIDVLEPNGYDTGGRTLKEIVDNAERECIMKTLLKCGGNVTKAAEILGLPRQTLKFRMDKLKINNFKSKKK